MKNRLLVLTLALFAFITSGHAQTDSTGKSKNSTPEQRAKLQTDRMKDKLVLSDDQYKQVLDINTGYAQKLDPILKSDKGKFAKYRQAKPLLDEKDKKLKGVLTPDQYKQWQDLKKEMMEQAKDNRS